MVEEIANTNDMPPIETQEARPGFDNSLYEGYRAKIDKVEIDWVQNCFPDGQTYNPNSTEKKWVMRITTEPLKVVKKNESGEVVKTDEDMEFTDNETGETRKMTISS